MPSKSKSQQRLMGAAEHGADFPMANELRESMSHNQLHDFAVGSMAGKPEHVPLVKGDTPSIVSSNTNTLKQQGKSERDSVIQAIGTAKKTARHKNLGPFLHKRKDGKPHGS